MRLRQVPWTVPLFSLFVVSTSVLANSSSASSPLLDPILNAIEQASRQAVEPIELRCPPIGDMGFGPIWEAPAGDAAVLELSRRFPLIATATTYRSHIREKPEAGAAIMGHVRYGRYLRAAEAGGECEGGHWHEVVGGGFICSGEYFHVGDAPLEVRGTYAAPNTADIEPYRYAKAIKGSPRFSSLPSPEQLAELDEDPDAELDIIQERLNGAYFLAVDREATVAGQKLLHTSAGLWVRAADAEWIPRSPMHGELLGPERELPIAFVHRDRTRLLCPDPNARGTAVASVQGGAAVAGQAGEDAPAAGDAPAGDAAGAAVSGEAARPPPLGWRVCGSAGKHARFAVRRTERIGDAELVIGPEDWAAEREALRIARAIERPDGIPAGERWMHIDLGEQTLVAYQDDEPLLATLVSSGLDSHATPTGTYRVQRRYIVKTMRGPDPDHGVYEVGEVPWTFYYYGNYAVHGAYWHNVFGNQRSHGCTNVPPADARWLFGWLGPRLGEGWNARLYRESGWTHFTD